MLIEEVPSEELIRDGNSLIYQALISLPEAILGGPIEVPVIDTKVRLNVEPGTQPGKVLRLKGKGLPDVNGYGRGDLLVKVDVFVPKDITKDEKKFFEKLKDSESFKPKKKDKDSIFARMKQRFS